MSVGASLLAPVAFLGLGIAALAATFYVSGHTIVGGVICLICALPVASFSIPAGLGGIMMGLRFLLLPADWRAPG